MAERPPSDAATPIWDAIVDGSTRAFWPDAELLTFAGCARATGNVYQRSASEYLRVF